MAKKRRGYSPTFTAYPTPKKAAPAPKKTAKRAAPTRPVYSPPRAAYPTPAPRRPVAGPPTPSKSKLRQIRARNERVKTRRRQTLGGGLGFGVARDIKAAEAKGLRSQRERGYGGARDVKAADAKQLRRQRERGFGGARDRTARRELTQALKRARATERAYATSTISPSKTIRPQRRTVARGVQVAAAPGKTVGETGVGQATGRYAVAPALWALDQLQRTSTAAGGAARGIKEGDLASIPERTAKGFLRKGKVETPSEVALEDWKPKFGLGKLAKGAASLAIDIPTDVTTYATGGLIGVGRKAALKASEQAGEAAARSQYKTLRQRGDLSRGQAKKQAKAHGETVRRRTYEREARRRDVANERRGVTVGFAGRRTRKARRALTRKALPKPIAREVRRRGPAAPLTRATVALGKRKKGVKDIGRIPRTQITGRDISKATRRVASSVHAGVRPVRAGKRGDVAISHETNIAEKALRREGRAESERLIREAQSRYNALWGKLDDDDAVRIRDAIESGRLGNLKDKAARKRAQTIRDPDERLKAVKAIDAHETRLINAAKELRDEGRYLQRMESRAGPLAGRVGQRSRSREEVARSGAETQPPRLGPYERRFEEASTERQQAALLGTPAQAKQARRAERRAGKRLAKAQGQRASALEATEGVSVAKRERLREQARDYFPRATDEELDQLVRGGLVSRLVADIKPSRESVGRVDPQIGAQKQRKHRETVAALREGTPEQQAHAERLSENIREVQALRSLSGARSTGQAITNRKIADEFGQRLPASGSLEPSTTASAIGQGKSVYLLHRGKLEQLDAGKDFAEIKRAAMTPAQRAASDRATYAKIREAEAWNAAHPKAKQRMVPEKPIMRGGRYVVLDDAQVARVQGEEMGLGSKAGLEAWDAANRGFKSLALMTPQYLTRNFTGDMFNAWTEENAFRLMRNVVAGQRPLHALGQRERAQRIGNVDKRRKKLAQIEQTFTAFNRKIGRDPRMRTITLSPEIAREIAGPSAQRLYQVIRRGNPNLSKQQIQDQIEDNLRNGRVSPVAFAQLAERYGVVRQGRFQELMTEGRSPLKGKAGGTPWALITKRVEDSNRIGTFMSGLQRGMTPREAADRAIQIHFDYGDLTPIEKGVLRRLAPFYTFPSRNVPLQARQLVRRPGKYSTLEKIRQQAATAAGLQEGWENNLSDFEMRQIPIPFKFGDKVMTASIGSPFTDLNDVIGFGRGVATVGYSVTNPEAASAASALNVPLIPVKRAMEMLGPIKVFAEAPLNKSFYFREDIAPEGRELTRAPEWAIALSKIPGGYGRLWKQFARIKQKGDGPVMWDKRSEHVARAFQPGIIGMGSELAMHMGIPTGVSGENARGRTPKQRLAGYLTGARVVTYDPKQARVNRNYDRRFRLEATNAQERQLVKEQTGRDWEESDQSGPYKRRLEKIREINATIEGLQGKKKKRGNVWGAEPASAFSGGGSDGSVWK